MSLFFHYKKLFKVVASICILSTKGIKYMKDVKKKSTGYLFENYYIYRWSKKLEI